MPAPFFHEHVGQIAGAGHHGGHEPAAEFPGLDVDQVHTGRHEGDQGRSGHDALAFFGLARGA